MKFRLRRPLRAALGFLIASGLLFTLAPCRATMYSCLDAKGELLLQNSTNGCASNVCEIKANGAKECELTKEQRLAQEAKEKRDAECKDKRRRSMLKELGLLDKFSERKDIDSQRDRELAANAQDLRKFREARDGTRKSLQKLNVEADFYRPKRPLPSELSAEIADSNGRLAGLEADITKAEAKFKQINQNYDDLFKHYDRLLKREFEPVPCDPN